MFDFLFPSWRSRDAYAELEEGQDSLSPSPQRKSRSKSPQPKLQLNTGIISGPILHASPQSITGFDDVEGRWHPRSSNPSPKSVPSSSPSPSSARSGPSAIAWLRPQNPPNPQSSEDREQSSQPGVLSAPARVALKNRHMHPMDRSVSSPVTSLSTPMSSSSSSQRPPRPVPFHSRSTLSLRLDAQSQAGNMNTYPGGYHIVKPLSPIQEQDYFSPETPRRTIPLPAVSDAAASPISVGSKNSKGSNSSELTARPSPVHSNPFISRPVKRSLSQSSSKSASSTVASTVAPSIPPLDLRPPFPGPHPTQEGAGPPLRPKKSSVLQVQPMPTIEAAGSSEEYDGTEGDYSRGSLHADSFVTASDSSPRLIGLGMDPSEILEIDIGEPGDVDDEEKRIGVAFPVAFPLGELPPHYADAANSLLQSSDSNTALGGNPSSTRRLSTPLSVRLITPTSTFVLGAPATGTSSQSPSESFIYNRWERQAGLSSGSPLGSVRFKKQRKEWIYTTPAFWAFWFGFICPVLWLVGGWHFTRYGELPPKKTIWEFYFTVRMPRRGWWTQRLGWCIGKRNKGYGNANANANGTLDGAGPPPGGGVTGNPVGNVDLEDGKVHEKRKGKGRRSSKQQNQLPPLPRWIKEKQSTESKIFKRSLRGISFGYPFIPRPSSTSPLSQTEPPVLRKCWKHFRMIIVKPNRLFDQFYLVKLRHVKGKVEGRRRMFDPWIQRCRYAFCYAVLVFMAALATTSAYLIVYNTRKMK